MVNIEIKRQIKVKFKREGLNCLLYLPRTLKEILINQLKYDSKGFIYELPNHSNENQDILMPLILFLHGGGERGSNLDKLTKHGIPKIIETSNHEFLDFFQFIALSPQCPENKRWINLAGEIAKLLKEMKEKNWVDEKKVYLTGISIGCDGTIYCACKYPEMISAIAPVCIGVPKDLEKLDILSELDNFKKPVWIHQGNERKNPKCGYNENRVKWHNKIVEKWFESSKNIYVTTHNAPCHHTCWNDIYEHKYLYRWLLDPTQLPRKEKIRGNWNLIVKREDRNTRWTF